MIDDYPDLEKTHPYTKADLELVAPSLVREGDLLAHAGPQGTRRYVGDPVTHAAWGGYSTSWQDDVYRIEYRNRFGQLLEIVQPEHIKVSRVKEARRRDGSLRPGSGEATP